jgi:hypothetical protein
VRGLACAKSRRQASALHEPAVFFNAPVFADPQEDDPVNGLLDGEIQLTLGKSLVSKREIPGQQVPPSFYFFQKRGIHLRGPFFDFGGFHILVKGTF